MVSSSPQVFEKFFGSSLVLYPEQSELVLSLEVMHFKPGITLNFHNDRLEIEFPIITAEGIYRWKSYT